jgi:hypothetical protein
LDIGFRKVNFAIREKKSTESNMTPSYSIDEIVSVSQTRVVTHHEKNANCGLMIKWHD